MNKVVIIGGGVLGLSTAKSLTARGGAEVTVLERNYIASGSSSLSAGFAMPLYNSYVDLRLIKRSYELLEVYEERGRVNLRRIGAMRLAHTPDDIATFKQSSARQAELGMHVSEVLDLEETSRVNPLFSPPADVIGSWWDSRAAYLDGTELCNAIAEDVREQGGIIVQKAPVTGVLRGQGAHKFTVQTPKGDFEADTVVIAAGPWAGQVGELFGTPITVQNERHEMFTFEVDHLDHPVPMLVDFIPDSPMGEGIAYRQEGERQIVASLHSSNLLHPPTPDPDDWSTKMDDERAEMVFGLLTEYFPDLDLRYRGGWAGLYPHGPTTAYQIGPHPADPDVIVGSGLAGRGLGPGLALGEVLADWVLGGEMVSIPGAEEFNDLSA
jgi:sarcosine oxidase subunit beta